MTSTSTGDRRTPAGRKDAMAVALRYITRFAGSDVLDRFGARKRAERAAYRATRAGFGAARTASRTFTKVSGGGAPDRLPVAAPSDLWDLTPTDEQQMMVDVVGDLAREKIRPAAAEADRAHAAPDDLVASAAELGIWQTGIPSGHGGFAESRSPVTSVLVAEALAHGDLGLAVACLAPGAVATALGQWGDADQQATYLPPFTGDDPPRAALAVTEPHPLFSPSALRTTATRSATGYRLDGVKSLVPAPARCELFVVAATVVVDGVSDGPALFVVESSAPGVAVADEPSMGLRAAQTGRVVLDGVTVPLTALLGHGDDEVTASQAYTECVRLARLAWCAVAVGTAQAVVDYVIPYVNEREAFGEPISHRQGVAFTVADMATELAGMRLATYRAAARAEQGKDITRELALARSLVARHGMRIGSDGVQLLGGHGFVTEHPVERWYRDLRAVSLMDGVLLA